MSAADVEWTKQIEALAERFIRSVQRGDIEQVESIYAEDAVIWHNYDQVEQTRDQNVRTMKWFTSRLAGMSYEDIRLSVLPDGWVQQHVLRGTAPNGTAIAVHAMLRVWVRDGRITRLDEYLDPAQAAPLSAPAS